jgi:hypothetical protein
MKCWEFLEWLRRCWLLKDSAPWVSNTKEWVLSLSNACLHIIHSTQPSCCALLVQTDVLGINTCFFTVSPNDMWVPHSLMTSPSNVSLPRSRNSILSKLPCYLLAKAYSITNAPNNKVAKHVSSPLFNKRGWTSKLVQKSQCKCLCTDAVIAHHCPLLLL